MEETYCHQDTDRLPQCLVPVGFRFDLVQLDQIYSAEFKDVRLHRPGHVYMYFGLHSGTVKSFCFLTDLMELVTVESIYKAEGRLFPVTLAVVSCSASIDWMSFSGLMDGSVIWLDGQDPRSE